MITLDTERRLLAEKLIKQFLFILQLVVLTVNQKKAFCKLVQLQEKYQERDKVVQPRYN